MREEIKTIAKRLTRPDYQGDHEIHVLLPKRLFGRIEFLCQIQGVSEDTFYYRAILEAVEILEMFTPECAAQDGNSLP